MARHPPTFHEDAFPSNQLLVLFLRTDATNFELQQVRINRLRATRGDLSSYV